jgi:hypothetical protein
LVEIAIGEGNDEGSHLEADSGDAGYILTGENGSNMRHNSVVINIINAV